jgi:hypothetical protein
LQRQWSRQDIANAPANAIRTEQLGLGQGDRALT